MDNIILNLIVIIGIIIVCIIVRWFYIKCNTREEYNELI